MASYKLRKGNAIGLMASSPLYKIPKPDRSEYDSQEAYDQAMIAYDRSLTPAAPIPSETQDVRGYIREKGLPFVKGAMQGQNPNVQFGGDGRRIVKGGGGNVGASSGTGGGKNQNITGISLGSRGPGGVGSGLTTSFSGLGKLGTTFNPDPLVIPPPRTQTVKKDKPVNKNTGGASNNKKTKVKKGPASTSIKPMQGLVDLGGGDLTQNISKVRATVDAARSSSNDLIKNKLDGSGRIGRVQRRQQAKTDRLRDRLEKRENRPLKKAQIKNIRETQRTTRQSDREKSQMKRDANKDMAKMGGRVPTKPASIIKTTTSEPKARLEKQKPIVVSETMDIKGAPIGNKYSGSGLDRSSVVLDQRNRRAKNEVSFGNEVVGAKNMTTAGLDKKPTKQQKKKVIDTAIKASNLIKKI